MPSSGGQIARGGAQVWPAFALLALGGVVVTVVAVLRWTPDASLHPTPDVRLLAQARAHAELLGYRPETPGRIQVSAGPRILATLDTYDALVRHRADPDLRRQLLQQAPALRLGVRFWRTISPNGSRGALLLEYDCDARLVGASFGYDFVLQRGLPPRAPGSLADELAVLLLGEPLPAREETGLGGPKEYLFRRDADHVNAYVYVGDDGRFMAELQPFPQLVVSRSQGALWDRLPLIQALAWTTGGLALLAVAVLLWRLTRRRAGFGQAPLMVAVLLLGMLPMLGQFRAGAASVAAVWAYYLLTQVAVLLAWTVAEAELREARPEALQHWDRLVGRRPVAETGRQLMLGVAFGCVLGGAMAASGELIGGWDGGYRSILAVLPDYWTLSSPVNQGVALAAVVAFLVGLGGRLGRLASQWRGDGGRPGAAVAPFGAPLPRLGKLGVVVGSLGAGLGWALITPVAPVGWSVVIGAVLALAGGWIAWQCGLLTLTAATVTALSLPTAAVAWSVPQHLLVVGLIASLPVPIFLLGWYLWRSAPQAADLGSVLPSYVADREQEARLAAEVEILRSLQLSLLPANAELRIEGMEVAWRMIPADVVGGDFLDLTRDDDGRFWMAVADVAGHGISCSLLTAFTKAAVAEHAVAGRGPAEALRGIRRLFGRLHHTRRTLVTLLLAVWDPRRRELRVASAGHPPLLVRSGGEVREVGLGGRPLGVELGGEEDREEVLSCPGEAVVVASTDGVGEAVAPNDDAFGYDRWLDSLRSLDGTSAAAMLDALLAEVDRHRSGRPATDDVTAAVVRLERPRPA